jgi:amino acid adenylation domain-containing protein
VSEKSGSGSITELSFEQKRELLAQLLRERVDLQPTSHPLSYGQQALWFLYQLAPESSAYHIILPARILSPIDCEALRHAFQALIERHPILRCTFASHAEGPMQRVQEHLEVDFETLDATDWDQARLDGYLEAECHRPFDLEKGPVFRAKLLSRSVREHILLLVAHHIVVDGRSYNILLADLRGLYRAAKAHKQPSLPPLRLQYWDYVRWQRQMLAGPEGEKLRIYWHKQLADAPAVLKLPVARPRPPFQRYRGASLPFALPAELTRALYELSKREGVTMYVIFLATLQVLLYRYSGQEDILVGTPAGGRTRADFEGLVGYFISPIVLRANLAGNPTFKALLQQVRATVRAGLVHQDFPFPLLVEQLHPQRDPSYSPIFQVVLDWQTQRPCDDLASDRRWAEMDGADAAAELELAPLDRAQQEGQFDLLFDVFDIDESISGALRYDTDLFDAPTISRMLGHFQTLLQSITANPDQSVALLPILTETERQLMLVEWNDTEKEYPRDRCVHELFERQAELTPDAVALKFEERRVTYRELNRRSNQLAHYLRTLGVGPEVLVGLCVERSPDMVVGILGILKAGGAYVPLDPAYPMERLAFMLEDARVGVLLTERRLVERVAVHPLAQKRVVCLDADWEPIAEESERNPESGVSPNNLAYVIYTSGSTGRPKGAMVRHRGLVNYLTWCNLAYPVVDGQGSVVHSPIAFDLTVTSLFAPLLRGRRVALVSEELGMEGLSTALSQEGDLSLIKITPLHLQLLGQQLSPEQAGGRTRAFIIGGENLLPEHIAFWQKHAPQTALINEYGPTETVVGCCVYRVGDEESVATSIPIGRPIINTRLYILDERLQPVPIGVTGELYVGGAGVGRGYLNRPDLTAERFLPDPFSAEPGARLYKTGDLARYLPTGNIECRGRADHQVKIRGFRIELGEIESVLDQHGAVRESVVVTREELPGEKSLVAYWVAAEGQTISPSELRSFLKEKLPDYMVPSAFVALDALPLTPNGKVDRRALPDPGRTRSAVTSEETFEAPRTAVESLIAEVWQDVLQVDRVGVQDNFFDLGGHSLLSLQVLLRLEKQLRIRMSPRDLIFHTLGQLAALCESRLQEDKESQAVSLTRRVMGAFRRVLPT